MLSVNYRCSIVNLSLNDAADNVLVFVNRFPKPDDVSHCFVLVEVQDIQKILVAIKFQLQ